MLVTLVLLSWVLLDLLPFGSLLPRKERIMSWSESVLECSHLSRVQASNIADEHGLKDEFESEFESDKIDAHILLD